MIRSIVPFMMELDRAALEQSKVELKTVLKAWEGRFRTEYGRKAGREDIKADPEIGIDCELFLGS